MEKGFQLNRLGYEENRPQFDCSDKDLNEFFQVDSKESYKELLSVTYTIHSKDNELIAFFSISNDSIRKVDADGRSALRRLTSLIPFNKRFSSMPAVKIGRLAVTSTIQSNGIGSQILDFLKGWFTEGNKTGCRFIIVDAYNEKRAIAFYTRNGFKFLSSKDESAKTRLMYFDLITFKE